MIRHTCQACGAALDSPASLAGRSEVCPACRRQNVVPFPPTSGLGRGVRMLLAVCVLVIACFFSFVAGMLVKSISLEPPPIDRPSIAGATATRQGARAVRADSNGLVADGARSMPATSLSRPNGTTQGTSVPAATQGAPGAASGPSTPASQPAALRGRVTVPEWARRAGGATSPASPDRAPPMKVAVLPRTIPLTQANRQGIEAVLNRADKSVAELETLLPGKLAAMLKAQQDSETLRDEAREEAKRQLASGHPEIARQLEQTAAREDAAAEALKREFQLQGDAYTDLRHRLPALRATLASAATPPAGVDAQEIVLVQRGLYLCGRGQPMPSSAPSVPAGAAGMEEVAGWAVVASAVVAEDGRFEVRSLPEGAYYLNGAWGTGASFLHWLVPFEVPQDSPQEMDLGEENASLVLGKP